MYIYYICMIGKISTCTDVREGGEGCVYVVNIYYSICLFLQYMVIFIIIAHFITYKANFDYIQPG